MDDIDNNQEEEFDDDVSVELNEDDDDTEVDKAITNLLRGVNMIGLPLKPGLPYTAKSLSQYLAGNSENTKDYNTDVTWIVRYDSQNPDPNKSESPLAASRSQTLKAPLLFIKYRISLAREEFAPLRK